MTTGSEEQGVACGSPARREKVAPSMAALYSRPGRMLPGLSPVITPEEWGQFGVRSPVM